MNEPNLGKQYFRTNPDEGSDAISMPDFQDLPPEDQIISYATNILRTKPEADVHSIWRSMRSELSLTKGPAGDNSVISIISFIKRMHESIRR